MNSIKKILDQDHFSKADIIKLLSVTDPDETELLRQKAWDVTMTHVGPGVYFRGLVEFSNICRCDCFYCGIRKSNPKVERYFLSKQEIVNAARWCAKEGYGSFVLQSGEQHSEKFIKFVEDVLRTIKRETRSERLPDGLGITLSVGEYDRETYQRFFDAGAHRYLLRIETTSPELFAKIHPPSQTLEKRKNCLNILKGIGFQTGTGVMIGLPEQTTDMLADDILFFRDSGIDMIGMGPYIVHRETPMRNYEGELAPRYEESFQLALRMIAVTRLVLKNANIAATTALQTLRPLDGRELGLAHGANVIMPQLTPADVRKNYLLYEGKPCEKTLEGERVTELIAHIESTGRFAGLHQWGDSRRFLEKQRTSITKDAPSAG